MTDPERDDEDFPEPHARSTSEEQPEAFEEDPADLTVILPEDSDLEGVGDDLTEEMAQLASDTEDDLPQEDTGPPEGTETEDVFVLLPEVDEEIPEVETEEVTIVNEDEIGSAEDVGLRDSNPLADETQVDMTDPEASAPGTLDELTSEFEDDLLTGEYSPEDAYSDEEGFETEESLSGDEDEHELYPDEAFDEAATPGGSGFKRVLLPLAATVLVGCGVFYYFVYPKLYPWKDGTPTTPVVEQPGTPDTDGSTGTVVEVVPPPEGPGTPLSDPVDVENMNADLLVASQQVFREKILLSIELGYVGKVSHE